MRSMGRPIAASATTAHFELVEANPAGRRHRRRGDRGAARRVRGRRRESDRAGIPLSVMLLAANTPDAALLEPLVDAVPPIVGPRGRPSRPRFRPAKLHADKAYDSKEKRRALRARSIARRGVESSERLGRYRWTVERTLAWLPGFRRLGVRYERRADLLLGMLRLARSLICLRCLTRA